MNNLEQPIHLLPDISNVSLDVQSNITANLKLLGNGPKDKTMVAIHILFAIPTYRQ